MELQHLLSTQCLQSPVGLPLAAALFQHHTSHTRLPTSLLISSWRSGAERAVARIMVEVWLSVSFLMHRCPATMLHTCRPPRQ